MLVGMDYQYTGCEADMGSTWIGFIYQDFSTIKPTQNDPEIAVSQITASLF